ncbi:MAG: hypothetical protein U0X93_05855 [Anaerolineales bacterium]
MLGFAGVLILATYSRGGLPHRRRGNRADVSTVGRAESAPRGSGLFLKLDIAFPSFDSRDRASLVGAGLFLAQKGYIACMFESDAESVQEFVVENSAGARVGVSGQRVGRV